MLPDHHDENGSHPPGRVHRLPQEVTLTVLSHSTVEYSLQFEILDKIVKFRFPHKGYNYPSTIKEICMN